MKEKEKLDQIEASVRKLQMNYTTMSKHAAAFDVQTTKEFSTMVAKDLTILLDYISVLRQA